MAETQTLQQEDGLIDSRFMMRVFYVFAALAILSVGVSLAGKWIGAELRERDHSTAITPRGILIGDEMLSVPENMIRFARARRDGVAEKIDLYMRWPGLNGYSREFDNDFTRIDGAKTVLYATVEPRLMSRDMSGRLEPIYMKLVTGSPQPAIAGLTVFRFKENSGYLDEALYVGERAGGEPFVSRCLTGAAATQSLAPCERDIHIGENLSVTYRFPGDLLADWRRLDDSMKARFEGFLHPNG